MLLGLQGCVFATGPPPSAKAWAALGRRATDMVVYERCPVLRPCPVVLCAMRAGSTEIAAAGGASKRAPTRRSSGGLGLLVLRFGWLYGSSPFRLDRRIDTLAELQTQAQPLQPSLLGAKVCTNWSGILILVGVAVIR